jgi:hypothetical protein
LSPLSESGICPQIYRGLENPFQEFQATLCSIRAAAWSNDEVTPEERFAKIENAIQALAERQATHETQIEKNTAAIRDLIVVSRTVLDAQKGSDERLAALIQAQLETERKLQAWIDRQGNGRN